MEIFSCNIKASAALHTVWTRFPKTAWGRCAPERPHREFLEVAPCRTRKRHIAVRRRGIFALASASTVSSHNARAQTERLRGLAPNGAFDHRVRFSASFPRLRANQCRRFSHRQLLVDPYCSLWPIDSRVQGQQNRCRRSERCRAGGCARAPAAGGALSALRSAADAP